MDCSGLSCIEPGPNELGPTQFNPIQVGLRRSSQNFFPDAISPVRGGVLIFNKNHWLSADKLLVDRADKLLVLCR